MHQTHLCFSCELIEIIKKNKTIVNMKYVIVFAALIAASAAALLPASQDAQATIVSQQADISPDHGQYSFS